MTTPLSRARGTLLGLACGDALGRPVEFQTPDQITDEHGQLETMVGHGTHNQSPGTITDDTQMALCIARSLAETRGFDPADISDRFVAWYESDPFDIGLMTRQALVERQQGEHWAAAGECVWQRRAEGGNAGNGSVMRCAPHAVAFADDHALLADVSCISSRLTHYDDRCQYGCVALNTLIASYLTGQDNPLDYTRAQLPDATPREVTTVLKVIPGNVTDTTLSNSGYVVDTLQAGVYHATTASSFKDAVVNGVMMGGDTDTIGAVTGAVAGARFGEEAIPESWLSAVDETDELRTLATQLWNEV